MYNNFIYRVSLPKCCRLDRSNIPRQPGTVEIPPDSVEFIFRLANTWADGMNPVNRVENEVAMMSLAAEALSSFEPRVVPAVYDWGSYDVTPLLAFAQGWILQELMRGTPLDESFGSMHLDQQSHILTQMANILLALQNFKLPESITHFGGVTFDGFGRIVSSAMSNVIGGPWSSYEAYYQHRLELALKRADANPYIRGWRYNKARWRLDTFVNVGVSHHFDTLEDKDEKVIVHADLNPNNLLFDATSQRITALLDYDFACIQHPSYEFLRSFAAVGGQYRSNFDIHTREEEILKEAMSHEYFWPPPRDFDNEAEYRLAEVWHRALKEVVMKRPRYIQGMEKVAQVDAVLGSILPWQISNLDMLRLQPKKVIWEIRQKYERRLIKLVNHLGYYIEPLENWD